MTHLERQLRDGIRRLLEAEPNPQARAAQIRALDALLTLPNVAALLDTIDALRAQEPPTIKRDLLQCLKWMVNLYEAQARPGLVSGPEYYASIAAIARAEEQ